MERVVEIEHVVAPLVAAAGLELFDVELTSKPAGVRVTVDSPEGVHFDVLAELSRRISDALDNSKAAPRAHYELEVSSPGVERTLRRPEHFARAIGEVVKVRTLAGVEGDRRVEGRLVTADDKGITVATEGAEERHIPYQEIERARTVFDWRAALAGTSSAKPAQQPRKQVGERAAAR